MLFNVSGNIIDVPTDKFKYNGTLCDMIKGGIYQESDPIFIDEDIGFFDIMIRYLSTGHLDICEPYTPEFIMKIDYWGLWEDDKNHTFRYLHLFFGKYMTHINGTIYEVAVGALNEINKDRILIDTSRVDTFFDKLYPLDCGTVIYFPLGVYKNMLATLGVFVFDNLAPFICYVYREDISRILSKEWTVTICKNKLKIMNALDLLCPDVSIRYKQEYISSVGC